jgi:hypothetical protein
METYIVKKKNDKLFLFKEEQEIGQISPDATWVKEGDEFDENELGWLLWDTRFPEDGDIFYEFSNEPEIKDKYSFKVICVIGPCGKFH